MTRRVALLSCTGRNYPPCLGTTIATASLVPRDRRGARVNYGSAACRAAGAFCRPGRRSAVLAAPGAGRRVGGHGGTYGGDVACHALQKLAGAAGAAPHEAVTGMLAARLQPVKRAAVCIGAVTLVAAAASAVQAAGAQAAGAPATHGPARE